MSVSKTLQIERLQGVVDRLTVENQVLSREISNKPSLESYQRLLVFVARTQSSEVLMDVLNGSYQYEEKAMDQGGDHEQGG